MLGYLILIVLQFAAAWYAGGRLGAYLPQGIGVEPSAFAKAVLYAVVVWVVGVLASFVIKDVRLPSTRTLVWALVFAIIGQGIVTAGLHNQIPLKFAPWLVPLGGAIIGYLIRR